MHNYFYTINGAGGFDSDLMVNICGCLNVIYKDPVAMDFEEQHSTIPFFALYVREKDNKSAAEYTFHGTGELFMGPSNIILSLEGVGDWNRWVFQTDEIATTLPEELEFRGSVDEPVIDSTDILSSAYLNLKRICEIETILS